MNALDKAGILVEALPYIKEFAGQTVVVKYGGNAMIDEELKKAVMQDVILLKLVGINVVLVHGGGPEISRLLKSLNHTSHFVNGLRYTDETTMEVAQMVLAGKINKDLTSMLEGKGIGLSGLDGNLFQAIPLEDKSGADYGYVGEIIRCNPQIIQDVIDKGYIPVISSVAGGLFDEHSYNVNADTAAAKVAAALKARKLILLTDVKGLLHDPSDESTLIRSLKLSQVPALVNEGVISGGMIPKVECCVEAVRQGVGNASIQDGRVPHSILIELLSNEGVGTMFY